jgi:hypothetical protein
VRWMLELAGWLLWCGLVWFGFGIMIRGDLAGGCGVGWKDGKEEGRGVRGIGWGHNMVGCEVEGMDDGDRMRMRCTERREGQSTKNSFMDRSKRYKQNSYCSPVTRQDKSLTLLYAFVFRKSSFLMSVLEAELLVSNPYTYIDLKIKVENEQQSEIMYIKLCTTWLG